MGNVIPFKHKPIHNIAGKILADWKKVSFHAEPYLRAMFQLDQISDMYELDSASHIVVYFLANAMAWRGDTACAIKKELKSIVALIDTDERVAKKAWENHLAAYHLKT